MPAVTTDAMWEPHEIGTLSWEQSMFVDIAGTGKPGLVGVRPGDTTADFGWFEPTPTGNWPFHVIGPAPAGNIGYVWEHGLGAGLNLTPGTGWNLIFRSGWFTSPAGGPASGPWVKHAFDFSNDGAIPGGSHHL